MFCREGVFVVEHPSCELEAVLLHESIAHHGVRQLLGRRAWGDQMVAVLAGVREGDPRLHAIRRHVTRLYGDDMPPRLMADEFIARLTELRADPRTGRLRIERPLAKRWAALRARIARDLLHRSIPATMEEVEGVLLESEGLIRDGRCSTVPWWQWYRAAMTKPMGASRPPRDLEESERWLRESRARAIWWDDTRFTVLGVAFIVAIPLWFWIEFNGVVDFLRMIFGR